MTQITIPLVAGRNYISFPAISSDNFGIIFTISGIKADIQRFFTYDPILGWTDVSDLEYIGQGRGYILDMTSPGNIIYDGIEYTLTFYQLKSRLLEGWNLIGPGSIPITPLSWCRVIDPNTGFPVTQLEPNKSYWISYYDCIQPITSPILLILTISLGISILSLYLSLRKMRTT